MKTISFAITDKGNQDKTNEDFYFADDNRHLYIVADGVGSYKGADTASRIAVQAAENALSGECPANIYERKIWLAKVVRKATDRMYAEAKQFPFKRDMSSTLTLVYGVENEWNILHIGDSRLYIYRSGTLKQYTRDHTVAYEQYEAGAITKDQIRDHPNQKLITRSLGPKALPVCDIILEKMHPDDRLLLCTDGLIKELPDSRIEEILKTADSPKMACESFVGEAKASGGHDNITVIVVDVKKQ